MCRDFYLQHEVNEGLALSMDMRERAVAGEARKTKPNLLRKTKRKQSVKCLNNLDKFT